MKKYRDPHIDEAGASELHITTVNDGDLYRSRIMPIYKNLARKKQKGIYQHHLAVKLMRYAVDEENKKYKQQYGVSFNPATRDKVAEEMVKEFESEYKVNKKQFETRVGRFLK